MQLSNVILIISTVLIILFCWKSHTFLTLSNHMKSDLFITSPKCRFTSPFGNYLSKIRYFNYQRLTNTLDGWDLFVTTAQSSSLPLTSYFKRFFLIVGLVEAKLSYYLGLKTSLFPVGLNTTLDYLSCGFLFLLLKPKQLIFNI